MDSAWNFYYRKILDLFIFNYFYLSQSYINFSFDEIINLIYIHVNVFAIICLFIFLNLFSISN